LLWTNLEILPVMKKAWAWVIRDKGPASSIFEQAPPPPSPLLSVVGMWLVSLLLHFRYAVCLLRAKTKKRKAQSAQQRTQ
jgi:hypothetical protein